MSGHSTAENESLARLIDLGHLSSGVGHHVINAFSAIVSNAELLRFDSATRPAVDPAALADTIIRTALDAATVARRLIDFTRPTTAIDHPQGTFVPHAVSLETFLADLGLAGSTRVPANVRLEYRLEAVPLLKGHPEQLACMINHLLDNAVEAIGPGEGVVTFGTRVDQRGWIVLEVSDTGAGMTTSTLERAIEPFYSTKPGHLGVGLSIAHGIWRRHRGTVAVQSRPGQGTVVRLCVEPAREGV